VTNVALLIDIKVLAKAVIARRWLVVRVVDSSQWVREVNRWVSFWRRTISLGRSASSDLREGLAVATDPLDVKGGGGRGGAFDALLGSSSGRRGCHVGSIRLMYPGQQVAFSM